MTIISNSCFRQNMCLTKLLIIAQFDVMNSRTFKHLCNEIQGFSSTCPVFKYFQGLEFRRKNSSTFKDFQGCVEPCNKLTSHWQMWPGLQ